MTRRSATLRGHWLRAAAAAALAAGWLGACATANENAPLAPKTLGKIEYYPYQVKGFQNTYPHREVVVLMPVDARKFNEPGATEHGPDNGNPMIGVILSADGKAAERIYSTPLAPIVQEALVKAVDESGMTAVASNQPLGSALKDTKADYVLESRITDGWVSRHRGPNSQGETIWFTAARFALDVTLYKPPFRVAFWQGRSADKYNDPPTDTYGMSSDVDTAIYDDPVEVMSVAFTRALAGVFKLNDLHTLVAQDTIRAH